MRWFFAAAALCLFIQFSSAQNLFDAAHAERFGQYLYTSGQYKLAANEFERVVFLDATNDTAKLFLLKSYRKAGDYNLGLKRLHDLYDDDFYTRSYVFSEWTYMHVLQNDFATVDSTVSHASLDDRTKTYVRMNTALLQKKWKPAYDYYHRGMLLDASLFKPYQPVMNDALHLKHKSAGAAAALSALVPGLGKVYTGQWKDGLIALVMIGASGYEAYRGYEKRQFKSGRFWAFGLIGTGFYFGNIYGSYKSAKKFNAQHENDVLAKARGLFMVGD